MPFFTLPFRRQRVGSGKVGLVTLKLPTSYLKTFAGRFKVAASPAVSAPVLARWHSLMVWIIHPFDLTGFDLLHDHDLPRYNPPFGFLEQCYSSDPLNNGGSRSRPT